MSATRRTDHGAAPSAVQTNVGVIRAVTDAAVEADLVGRSPLTGRPDRVDCGGDAWLGDPVGASAQP